MGAGGKTLKVSCRWSTEPSYSPATRSTSKASPRGRRAASRFATDRPTHRPEGARLRAARHTSPARSAYEYEYDLAQPALNGSRSSHETFEGASKIPSSESRAYKVHRCVSARNRDELHRASSPSGRGRTGKGVTLSVFYGLIATRRGRVHPRREWRKQTASRAWPEAAQRRQRATRTGVINARR